MSTYDKLREMHTYYPRGEYAFNTLSITHPLLSQSYYFTNDTTDQIVTLEDTTIVTMVSTPILLSLTYTKDDLDQNFTFTFPDLDNILDDEMDNIPFSNTVPIEITYRQYINTDVSAPAIIYKLMVLDISQTKGAFTITAGVKQLNWNGTGERYTFDRFPMLRAL